MLIYLAYLLPIVSGAADAAQRVTIKLTARLHNFALLAFGYFFALPIYAILLLIPVASVATGFPVIRPEFWWAVGRHLALFIPASILTVEAHRRSPFILSASYLGLTPLFLLVTSPWMGTGRATALGVVGVLLVVAGVYLLNTTEALLKAKRPADLLAPFRALAKERGSQFMIMVAFLFAFTANLDFIAIRNANIPFYLLVDHGAVSVAGGILALVYLVLSRRGKDPVSGKVQTFSPQGSWLGLMTWGPASAIATIPHYLAWLWVPNVPYTIAGKRMGTILFTVASGFALATMSRFGGKHEREREQWQWRVPGVALMVVGMLVIIFWGMEP